MSGILGRSSSVSSVISEGSQIMGELYQFTNYVQGGSTILSANMALATGTSRAYGPPASKSLGMSLGTSGTADGVFTFPTMGVYHILATINVYSTSNVHSRYNHINFYIGSANDSGTMIGQFSGFLSGDQYTHNMVTGQCFVYIDDLASKKFYMSTSFEEGNNIRTWVSDGLNHGCVFFMRMGDL